MLPFLVEQKRNKAFYVVKRGLDAVRVYWDIKFDSRGLQSDKNRQTDTTGQRVMATNLVGNELGSRRSVK